MGVPLIDDAPEVGSLEDKERQAEVKNQQSAGCNSLGAMFTLFNLACPDLGRVRVFKFF
jgi:hypothetical protein